MAERIDMVGKRCGRLTVIEYVGAGKGKSRYALWKCRCDCGNEIIASGHSLRSGNTKSCGCYNLDMATKRIVEQNTTHGKTHSRLYRVWSSIKTRCRNKNATNFDLYGDRGIDICEEWANSFQSFFEWSISNGYDETAKRGDCTIDRIDNSKGYSPDNCRWVNMKTQNNNRRSNTVIEYGGESHTITERAEIKGLTVSALLHRLYCGRYTVEESLNLPRMRKRKPVVA